MSARVISDSWVWVDCVCSWRWYISSLPKLGKELIPLLINIITLYHVRADFSSLISLQSTRCDPPWVYTLTFSPWRPTCRVWVYKSDSSHWYAFPINFIYLIMVGCEWACYNITWCPQPFLEISSVPVFKPRIVTDRGPANLCSMYAPLSCMIDKRKN